MGRRAPRASPFVLTGLAISIASLVKTNLQVVHSARLQICLF